jgi:hypothetical protein
MTARLASTALIDKLNAQLAESPAKHECRAYLASVKPVMVAQREKSTIWIESESWLIKSLLSACIIAMVRVNARRECAIL